MIDASHDNSGKDPARQPEVVADLADQIAGGQRSDRRGHARVVHRSRAAGPRAGQAARVRPVDHRRLPGLGDDDARPRPARRRRASTPRRARALRRGPAARAHRRPRSGADRRLDRARRERSGSRAPRWWASAAARSGSTARVSSARSTAPPPTSRRRSTAPRPASRAGRWARCPSSSSARSRPRRRTASSPTSGSTKRRIVEAITDERFVGGHPIAGAETAGVEHARADLFQGATWYLTPGERSSGLLYERLHRFVVAVGARPIAIDAETHDRLLATVSHLPHVIANVLVGAGGARARRAGRGAAASGAELSRRHARRRREHRHLDRHLPLERRVDRGRGGRDRPPARGGRGRAARA